MTDTPPHIQMLKGAIVELEEKLREKSLEFDEHENTVVTNSFKRPRTGRSISQVTMAANKLGTLFTECETLLHNINDNRAKLGQDPKTLEDYGI